MNIDRDTIIVVTEINNEDVNSLIEKFICSILLGNKKTKNCYEFQYNANIISFFDLVVFFRSIIDIKTDQIFIWDIKENQFRRTDIHILPDSGTKLTSAIIKKTTANYKQQLAKSK